MKEYIKERTLKAARYLVEQNGSIREAADALKINRSTVQMDLRDHLPLIDPELASKVDQVKRNNIAKFGIGGKGTVVECECTNCRYNTAKYLNDKGFCNKSKIRLKYKDNLKTEEDDYTDVTDCMDYEWQNKGHEFRKER